MIKRILLTILIAALALNFGCASASKQTESNKGSNKIQRTADHVGSSIDKAAKETGKGLEIAAGKTGQTLDTAAQETGRALERAWKKVKNLFEE